MAITAVGTNTNADQFGMAIHSNTFTLAHTLVAGSDRKVICYLNCISDAPDTGYSTTTGVTYGGNAMTLAVADGVEADGLSLYIETWYIDEDDLPATGSRDCVASYANAGDSIDIEMMVIAQYAGIASGVPDETDAVADSDFNTTITNTMSAIPSTSWAFSQTYSASDSFTVTWSDSQVEIHDGEDGFPIVHQGVAELQGGSSETSLVTTASTSIIAEWYRIVAIWDEPAAAATRNRLIIT